MHILIPNKNISFNSSNGFTTVDASNPNFDAVVALCEQLRYDEANELSDLRTVVLAEIANSDVTLDGDTLYFRGTEVVGLLARRITDMIRQGISVLSLVAFLENLMENPSKRAVEELYGFLEASQLPITQDGYFLAYKAVTSAFLDKHTGKISNAVGATVSMPRNEVNDDKDQTCSDGLHFAAQKYASGFASYGDNMVILKINPRDVVSIPSDYNNEKGRCCEYTVIMTVPVTDTSLVGASVVDISSYDPTAVTAAPVVDTAVELWDCLGEYDAGFADFPVDDTETEYDLTHETTGHTYWDAKFINSTAQGGLLFKTERGLYLTLTDDSFDEWTIELA